MKGSGVPSSSRHGSRRLIAWDGVVRVAFGAQPDQVLFHVATGLASEFEVVDLQVLHAAARLASPAIAF